MLYIIPPIEFKRILKRLANYKRILTNSIRQHRIIVDVLYKRGLL